MCVILDFTYFHPNGNYNKRTSTYFLLKPYLRFIFIFKNQCAVLTVTGLSDREVTLKPNKDLQESRLEKRFKAFDLPKNIF